MRFILLAQHVLAERAENWQRDAVVRRLAPPSSSLTCVPKVFGLMGQRLA